MRAKKILFNGDIHTIDGNLQNSIQKSLDNSFAGAFIVNNVKVDKINSTIEINISWNLKDYYQEQRGNMTLDEAILVTGAYNKGAEQQLPLLRHPFAHICHYHFDITDLVAEYNLVMKRNNKLKGMSVNSTPSEVTFTYQF